MEFACDICGAKFAWSQNLKRHKRSHTQVRLSCEYCNYTTPRRDNLTRHYKVYHKADRKLTTSIHKYVEISRTTSTFPATALDTTKQVPSFSSEASADTPNNHNHPSIETILTCNKKWIDDYERVSDRHQDLFNFRITNPTTTKLLWLAERIFQRQQYAFKLNLSFGYVLYNNITGAHEYYYASTNNRMFPKPITVRNREDMGDLVDALDIQDVLEYCKMQRSNSQYVVERITNVLFYINKLKPFTIGCPVELPNYIADKRCVIAMVRDRHGMAYNDQICLFRCIAFHTLSKKFEQVALHLAQQYLEYYKIDLRRFKGVSLKDIILIENLFNVNIEVYELVQRRQQSGETATIAQKVHTSRKIYPDTVNLNLYQNHFSYIQNLNKYSRQWSCKKCRKYFITHYNVEVHERSCLEATNIEHPGGGYGLQKSIFELLREYGCEVAQELEYYPYRIAFDFEAFLKPVVIPDPQAKLKYTRILTPASVSVCSNVPGYDEPKCFVSEGDEDALVDSMYNYIRQISLKSSELLRVQYGDIISWLREKLEEIDDLKSELNDLTDETDRTHSTELINSIYRGQIYRELSNKLNTWLRQIPLLGFNSGKFDVNMVRKYMFPYLLQKGSVPNHIIKKGNDYLAIMMDDFIMIDMKNFLAPGTSYAKWLKSVDVSMHKSFFPYEWFQSLDQLDENKLVAKKYFWSDLKQEGISDADYRHLQKVWQDNNFQNMRDLLIYYNNLDTLPFIHAASKIHDHWRELGIDAFKSSAISLPGLALQLLMRRIQSHTILPLIRDPEHFSLITKNIVGGLSIVFHRYHEAGITQLPNGKPVSRILSHDCNSLYLWALGEDMGTGLYAIWEPSTSPGVASMTWVRSTDEDKIMRWYDIKQTNDEVTFHRSSSYRNMNSQTEWLEYVAFSRQIAVGHKYNGREKIIRITSKVHYPVDGYCSESNTVFQFNGCYWHGHGCSMDSEKNEWKAKQRYESTLQIETNIQALNYNVETIWECEWHRLRSQNSEIDTFLELNLRLRLKTNALSGGDLLRQVTVGNLFGMVECDIEVPWFNSELLSYFEEFPPIYKNTQISLNDIHGLMKRYATENGMLNKPRKCLVNSFWARKILLTTPILKWYLQKGIVVTKVYRVIEMKSKRCFADLRQEIANHRRKGDVDPKYKPQGENWKLVGNSCYGKSITNKLTHKETMIVGDETVGRSINDKRFSKMEEVGNTAYEVCMDKKKIRQDLPVTIGYFVYNASKLRMLQFVYDFLKKYLRPGSYQLVCSDTDSIIAAYEDPDLDKLVRPEVAGEYFSTGKRQYLVVDAHGLREPGLFKIERECHVVVALCSKTYFTWNSDDKSVKLSTKGLSKQTNHFTLEDFMNVLTTRTGGSGVNRGMRMRGKDMMQYEQERLGLSYLYIKRHVEDDGISTRALDI